MDFIKKHPFFVLWTVLVIITAALGVSFLYIFLGSLLYLLLVLLMRLPSSLFWLGYLLQARLRKTDAAYRCYTFGYEHGARPSGPMIAYGMQLLTRGEYPKALTVLEEVVTNASLSDGKGMNATFLKVARQDLAIAYWKNGDLSTAISTLETMRKDYDILNTDFYTTLAYFYIEQGDLVTAEEVNNEALLEDEGCGPAYDNLAQIRYQEGDLTEARELFEKALELRDTMASSKYYLGLIAEAEGNTDLAATYYCAAHSSTITGINTVTREEVDAKYHQYY